MHRFLFALAVAVAARGAFAENMKIGYVDVQRAVQEVEEGKAETKRLLQVVAEVSDRENFTFVLDKAALLYAPAASDVTNEVVRRYNERFGKGETKAAKSTTPNGKPPPAPPKK